MSIHNCYAAQVIKLSFNLPESKRITQRWAPPKDKEKVPLLSHHLIWSRKPYQRTNTLFVCLILTPMYSNSRQFSSSDPSLQSVSPSQYQCSAIQLPSVQRNSLSEHLRMSDMKNKEKIWIKGCTVMHLHAGCSSVHLPHCSSLLSPQSLSPSQCHRLRMQ